MPNEAIPAGQAKLLCRIDDISEPGALGIDLAGQGEPTIFVVRRDGAVFAYQDICPHYGRTRLAWKRNAYLTGDGSRIMCSAHGALFRIEDGACVSGPCLDQRLTAVPIEVRDQGVWLLPATMGTATA